MAFCNSEFKSRFARTVLYIRTYLPTILKWVLYKDANSYLSRYKTGATSGVMKKIDVK